MMSSDMELVREYADSNSEQAFASLVYDWQPRPTAAAMNPLGPEVLANTSRRACNAPAEGVS